MTHFSRSLICCKIEEREANLIGQLRRSHANAGICRQRDVQPGICRRALHVRNRFATLWGEIGGFGALYLQEKSNYGKYIESTEPPRPGIEV